MSIEGLINECHHKGMKVKNLFELGDGSWRCHLTHCGNWTDSGYGKSAGEAIADAILRTEKRAEAAVAFKVESAEDLL